MNSILQEKRLEQINYVVENSKHVKINKDKLDEWADSIKESHFNEHPWAKYKNTFSEKEMIMLCFLIESMNFCFWKEPYFIYKDQKRSTAMIVLFIDAVIRNKKLLDTEYLINLRYEDLIDLFGVEEGNLKK